jgi:nucleoside-diphosphate-sugar epimerase
MNVFVTGASGLLGAHVVARLVAAGHRVAGTVRGGRAPALAVAHRWRLDEPLPAGWLADQQALVHCAYDPADEGANLRGTRAAIAAARAAGVARQVFVSSFSAVADATSAYGRTKYELERECRELGVAIVRPGLVIGPGGMFGRMIATVRRWPVIPLPGGGRRPVPVVGIDDAAACIEALLGRGAQGEHNLCYAHRPALRQLLGSIARALDRRRWFLPIPIGLLIPPVRMLQRLGIRTTVDTESLRAYATNTVDQHASHFAAFGRAEPELDAVVAAAVCGPASNPLRV